MRQWTAVSVAVMCLVLGSCRTMVLANKTIQINKGDDRSHALEVMGTPQNRQFIVNSSTITRHSSTA